MTDITNRVLPPPRNWQDFERLCFDLYSRMWRTNDAEMNGRQGQPQAGVDVYGTDRHEGGRFVGVQCKGKDQGYGGAVTEKELREEIEKAKNFDPPLQVFVLATTASNDVAIQRVARRISRQHAKQALFEVRVQGWDTLQQRITDYSEILRKHYPDLAPVDITARIDASIEITEREGEQTRTEIARLEGHLTAITDRVDAGGNPLQAQIIQAARLTDDGSARAAIRALRRIQDEQGDKLLGRNLYRLHSGIGVAHIALGELPDAIRELRTAFEADPEWPSARSGLAVAELLGGDRTAAFERAKHALRDDPSLHQAASVVIDAAPAEMAIANIEALIPTALRNRVDVAIALSLRARRSSDFTAAEEYVRRVMTSLPDDLRVLSTLAEVILEPILSTPGIGLTRLVPPEHQARFDEALDLLQRAWEQLKHRDDVWRYDHVVANLTTILDVAGREAESGQILEDALRIAPESTPLLRRNAQRLAKNDNWQGALASIESIRSGLEPPDELLRLDGLLRTGKAEIALNEARAFYDRMEDDRMREAAATLRIEAASALGSLASELDATLPAFPSSIVLRSVSTGLLGESDHRREKLLTEIDHLIADIHDPHDRFYAAESLYKARQYSRAADLYDGLHGTDKDDPALRRRLIALFFTDRRLDARRLFDSLHEQVKTLPQYAEIGAAIYERAGLLAQCRAILERSLLRQEDLQRRLQWLSLSERLDEPEVVTDWLKKVPPDQQGRPRDLIMLSLTIDRYLGDPKCLPIAYRALRAGYDDPQIHLGYISIFLMGRTGRGQIDTPTEIGPDTAVILVEKDGERRLVRILETEPNPRVDRDEVSPNDPLAIRLVGLREGDEMETRALGIGSITYVVTTIQNKYVYAHFRSLERFESMFPESRAFGSFKIDPTKGEEGFKPIFDAVKRRGEFARQIEDMYRTGNLPLAIGAKLGGSDGFEFWESIHSHPGLQFNVVLGNHEDYETARKLLSENHRAVIDPITLWGIVRLRIAESVRSSFDDLGVVQTTLDLLRRTVEERRQNRGVEQGTLAWDGEHYRMAQLGPEVIEYRISEAEAVLSFAETLTRLPAEASVEMPDEARKLYEDLDPSYFDTILAARGDNRILLSDDKAFRALSTEAIGVQGVWSQATVMSGLASQKVRPDDYFTALIRLIDARYFYTSINSAAFLHALRQSNWEITPTIRIFCELLARPQNDAIGVSGVLSELVRGAWAEKPDDREYEDFFTALFAAFRRADPQRDLGSLAQIGFSNLQAVLRRELLKARLAEELRNSTYLTPVPVAMKEVDQLRRRVVSRIGRCLRNAINRADPFLNVTLPG